MKEAKNIINNDSSTLIVKIHSKVLEYVHVSTLGNSGLSWGVSVGVHEVDSFNSHIQHQTVHQGNVVLASCLQLCHL